MYRKRLALRRPSFHGGMTLLEVLAVSALLAVVTTITLHLMVDGSRRNHRRLEHVLQVRLLNAALESIAQDLETAVPVLGRRGRSAVTIESRGEDQNLDRLALSLPKKTSDGWGAVKQIYEVATEKTDEEMYQLAALLPPVHRGLYSDLGKATENHLRFTNDYGSNLPPNPAAEAFPHPTEKDLPAEISVPH